VSKHVTLVSEVVTNSNTPHILKKMDTQQMLELLLARLDENAKTMNEKMDATISYQ
jgi:hypothetical protein